MNPKITIRFNGTLESLIPLFPLERSFDFDEEKKIFYIHERYGTDVAEIGDYIHKDEGGFCWVSPMNRITTQ